MKRYIIAWIKKYILHVESPSAHCMGYKYEWDALTKDSYVKWTDDDWEKIVKSSGICSDCRNGECNWKPKVGTLTRFDCPDYVHPPVR